MSDPTTPPPDAPAEPPPSPAEPPRRGRWLPWLTGAGFIVVAAALIWVWRHPWPLPQSSEPTEALVRQLSTLESRVARLEQRPTPQAPDLAPLNGRITALEQRPAPQPGTSAPAPDLAPLEMRIAALEHRQPPDLGPLEARIAAMEGAGRSLHTEQQVRLQADEARIGKVEEAARRLPLVLSATLALAFGQRLGDLPGAPPALARFSDASPPTVAELRIAFRQAARNALASAQPAAEGKPLLARLWAQAQDLVTIRQGDHVLIGDPVAGVLERARAALDAGDLAEAVSQVASLQGAPAQAMAGWLGQARSLLDARAALAAWAASG
jgi:hypothetical protein